MAKQAPVLQVLKYGVFSFILNVLSGVELLSSRAGETAERENPCLIIVCITDK